MSKLQPPEPPKGMGWDRKKGAVKYRCRIVFWKAVAHISLRSVIGEGVAHGAITARAIRSSAALQTRPAGVAKRSAFCRTR